MTIGRLKRAPLLLAIRQLSITHSQQSFKHEHFGFGGQVLGLGPAQLHYNYNNNHHHIPASASLRLSWKFINSTSSSPSSTRPQFEVRRSPILVRYTSAGYYYKASVVSRYTASSNLERCDSLLNGIHQQKHHDHQRQQQQQRGYRTLTSASTRPTITTSSTTPTTTNLPTPIQPHPPSRTMLPFKSFFQQFISTPAAAGTCGDSDSDIYPTVRLPPVAVVDVEQLHEKRDRAVRHLVKLNHLDHSVLYGGYRGIKFHNHIPHHLGSAYLMGANDKLLHDIYDSEAGDMEKWVPSPSEVTQEDWRNFLGDFNYQRAYLDFFEDEVVRQGYEWKSVLLEFLLKGEKPLINGLFCGLSHPLIHLGYAIEFNSREIAMEALTLTATSYDHLHDLLDTDIPPPTPKSLKDPLEILRRVRDDARIDGVFDNPGQHNQESLFPKLEEVFVEYLDMLDVANINPTSLLLTLVRTSLLLLLTTHKPQNPQFDFFLLHALTSAWAVRTILPILPARTHLPLLRGLWMAVLNVYFEQMRPSIKPELIDVVDTEGVVGGWGGVVKMAMEREAGSPEAHFIKGVRAMKEFAALDSGNEEFYFKAAVKFVKEFRQWVGFTYSDETLDIKP